MLTYITIPGTALADIMESVGSLFTDTWSLIAIAIGIGLFFYAVPRIKGWFGR
jgi:hypothetical protein